MNTREKLDMIDGIRKTAEQGDQQGIATAQDELMAIAATEQDARVISSAVYHLGEMHAQKAADLLADLVLSNPDEKVRSRAAWALMDIGGQRAITRMLEVIGGLDYFKQGVYATALTENLLRSRGWVPEETEDLYHQNGQLPGEKEKFSPELATQVIAKFRQLSGRWELADNQKRTQASQMPGADLRLIMLAMGNGMLFGNTEGLGKYLRVKADVLEQSLTAGQPPKGYVQV